MKGRWTVVAAIVLCVAVACLSACGGRGSLSKSDADEVEIDSVLLDSIFESEDTFDLDDEPSLEVSKLPQNELFDDFIFKFDNSARLQRSRVHFPLPVSSVSGETQSISLSEWRHHSLFLGQDFCTVLWNSRSQMDLAKDSSVIKASIEHIYLHSRTINSYLFERDTLNGQWMLTQISDTPFEDNILHQFFDFYRQFATDSTYQRLHVRSPLRFTTIDEDAEYETISGTIDPDQWFEFAPELPQDVITNVNYGQAYPNPNRMVLQMRGLANGLQTLMVFQRDLSGNWQLTDYEN